MAQQHIRQTGSLFSAAMSGPVSPAGWRKGAGSFAMTVVGAPREGGADRLLERALADAGLESGMLHMATAMPPAAPGSRLIVALGAEAASALLHRPITLALERGRILAMPDGRRLLVTEHPAAILRLADAVARGREYRRLVNDLLHAVPFQRRAA